MYGTTKEEAIRAEAEGLPSLLPNANRWKTVVEDHRWGRRDQYHVAACPVCALKSEFAPVTR